jgi:hypothetical protein
MRNLIYTFVVLIGLYFTWPQVVSSACSLAVGQTAAPRVLVACYGAHVSAGYLSRADALIRESIGVETAAALEQARVEHRRLGERIFRRAFGPDADGVPFDEVFSVEVSLPPTADVECQVGFDWLIVTSRRGTGIDVPWIMTQDYGADPACSGGPHTTPRRSHKAVPVLSNGGRVLSPSARAARSALPLWKMASSGFVAKPQKYEGPDGNKSQPAPTLMYSTMRKHARVAPRNEASSLTRALLPCLTSCSVLGVCTTKE